MPEQLRPLQLPVLPWMVVSRGSLPWFCKGCCWLANRNALRMMANDGGPNGSQFWNCSHGADMVVFLGGNHTILSCPTAWNPKSMSCQAALSPPSSSTSCLGSTLKRHNQPPHLQSNRLYYYPVNVVIFPINKA